MTILGLIGLLGAFFYILSYWLLQLRRDFAKTFTYSFLNLCGAFFVVVSLTEDWNLASFIIQSVWIVISMYGLIRCLKYHVKDQEKDQGQDQEKEKDTAIYPAIAK